MVIPGVFEEKEDAFFGQQAADEMQIAFAVLYTVIPPGILLLKTEDIGLRSDAGLLEDLGHDAGHIQILEDPAVVAQVKQGGLWHQQSVVKMETSRSTGVPALVYDTMEKPIAIVAVDGQQTAIAQDRIRFNRLFGGQIQLHAVQLGQALPGLEGGHPERDAAGPEVKAGLIGCRVTGHFPSLLILWATASRPIPRFRPLHGSR